jgi:tRNA(Ile)-lysidine synthetase-like protein
VKQDYIALSLPALRAASPALRRNLFRKAAHLLSSNLRDVDFDALTRAASLHPADLAGGLRTVLEGDTLYLTGDVSALPASAPQVRAACQLPGAEGELVLGNGWILSWETMPSGIRPQSADPFTAALDADLTAGRLRVRLPGRGERFEPLGMPGQRVKISDLMINLKIPKRLRANYPLVCVDDEIAWVSGLRMAHAFRVTDATRRVMLLRVRREQNA